MDIDQRAEAASADLVRASVRTADTESRLAELPGLRRRRARARAMITAAAVAVVMVIGGTWFATSTAGSLDRTTPPVAPGPTTVDPTTPSPVADPTALRQGFLGLPPQGATPSSPPTGDLVLAVMTRKVRVWVYADGRMITWRNGTQIPYADPATPNPAAASGAASGFLEQHLTAEGVEQLRSYLVESATRLNPVDPPISPDRQEPYLDPLVKVDGRIATAAVPGCGWETVCARITAPETWLPASAWIDQQYRAYVPSEVQICYEGYETAPDDFGPSVSDPAPTPVERVRAALPADVSLLLWPVMRPEFTINQEECAVVSTEVAHAVDRSLGAAGFQARGPGLQAPAPYVTGFVFPVPPAEGGTDPTQGRIGFQSVLPHGVATCGACE